MLKIGEYVGGKYKILHRIGHGGMSNVYLALNERANKQWAVKEVRKDGGRNEEVIRQNLIAETSILRELRHPNLPSIIDVIQEEDTYLILMDYIEGITLSKKLAVEGAQKESDVVKWAIQICDVLGYLHSQDPPIIYRDTKPSNIMLKPDGDVVLIDFGTARVYKETADEDTSWLGTRGYAAPEQFGGHGQTDERTDIYNLGATMYHLVTGHNPSKFPYEMYPIRHWIPDASSGLEFIILKCTRKNPDERYQNCAELTYALKHYMEMEEDYVKKQSVHLGVFIGMALVSAACFIGSVLMNHQASSMTNATYASLIKDAESATTEDAMLDKYLEAITTDPSEKQAYEEIMDRVFLSDGNFTQQEAERMLEILSDSKNGKSNETILKSHPEEYDEFAYKLGLSYFYYYEGTGNKPMSQPWFKIAKESTTIDDVKRNRAERFYKIADYYSSLSNKDRAGDNTVSYKDYWNDLTALTDGNLVAADNETTALVMYKELIYQLTMHANEFRKAGVTEEEMTDAVANIRVRLSVDFDRSKMDADEINEIEAVDASAEKAFTAINTAFSM